MAEDFEAKARDYMERACGGLYRAGKTMNRRYLVIGGTLNALDARQKGPPCITADTLEQAMKIAEDYKKEGRTGRMIVDLQELRTSPVIILDPRE